MREFIYYSQHAHTTGNFDDLMKAGRMDIACHIVISAFFLSHALRDDVKLHLVFAGPPDPTKHIEMLPKKALLESDEQKRVDISKKDSGGLIKRILFKYRRGEKREAFPGYWIEKKNIYEVLNELIKEGKTIYVLDKAGEDIRNIKIADNPVFLLGDHAGLPGKEFKRIKSMAIPVSIGSKMYFASQVVAIVNNELDRRG
ncbi:MAG: hypothetical protein AABX65_03415 [Nanoarchaeota archaeon]